MTASDWDAIRHLDFEPDPQVFMRRDADISAIITRLLDHLSDGGDL